MSDYSERAGREVPSKHRPSRRSPQPRPTPRPQDAAGWDHCLASLEALLAGIRSSPSRGSATTNSSPLVRVVSDRNGRCTGLRRCEVLGQRSGAAVVGDSREDATCLARPRADRPLSARAPPGPVHSTRIPSRYWLWRHPCAAGRVATGSTNPRIGASRSARLQRSILVMTAPMDVRLSPIGSPTDRRLTTRGSREAHRPGKRRTRSRTSWSFLGSPYGGPKSTVKRRYSATRSPEGPSVWRAGTQAAISEGGTIQPEGHPSGLDAPWAGRGSDRPRRTRPSGA